MKIWGGADDGGPSSIAATAGASPSPSSSPLAEKAKAVMSKHRSVQLETMPVIPSPQRSRSTDGADTFTTSDDATKYKLNPEQLKRELREGRQMDTPSRPYHLEGGGGGGAAAAVANATTTETTSSAERDEPAPDIPSASAEATPTKKAGLGRKLFGGGNKDQAPVPATRDQIKVVYRQFGPDATEVLTVEHDAGGMPSPNGPDHVVIKIQASTVTLDDCLMRRGFDFDVLNPLCLPQTPGFDVVGTICVCGAKTPGFDEGDRVAAMVRTGGNARYLSVPVSSLVKIPRSIDAAEAAAMVSIYTTAYQTLKRITQKGPMFSLLGNKIMIVGGMDAVGQALIQMCHKARAEIYATGPKHRHSYLRNILNVHPLPEHKEEWLPMVRGRMDFVFDGVCEDGLDSSRHALKEKGEVVCYGHAAMMKQREMGFFGAPLAAHINRIWSQQASNAKHVDIWQSFQEDPETFKKNLKSLCQLLKWNKVKPHISKRVTLTEVAAAQAKLESGEIRGTVICLPWKKMDMDG